MASGTIEGWVLQGSRYHRSLSTAGLQATGGWVLPYRSWIMDWSRYYRKLGTIGFQFLQEAEYCRVPETVGGWVLQDSTFLRETKYCRVSCMYYSTTRGCVLHGFRNYSRLSTAGFPVLDGADHFRFLSTGWGWLLQVSRKKMIMNTPGSQWASEVDDKGFWVVDDVPW